MSALEVTVVEGLKVKSKSPNATNVVFSDAPKQLGGGGEEMSATDLFVASLGACMLTMMGLKAKGLGIDLAGARAEVEKTMVLQPVLKFTGFHIHLHMPAVAEEHRAGLEKAAHECPVSTCLSADVKKDVQFHWG